MSIYSPIIITEEVEKRFNPTRLYIKRHTTTGLRYLGKSSRQDILEYVGSGTRWRNHINKYGMSDVVTDWVSDWFNDPHDLQDFALLLSETLEVVESDSWANLKPETGLDGGPGATFSDEERMARSNRASGENNPMYGTSRSGEENPFYGRQHKESSKKQISDNKTGKKMPESHRLARKKHMLSAPKTQCPHCKRLLDPGNYAKSHGDKCKKKPKANTGETQC